MSTDEQEKTQATWPLRPPPVEVPADNPFAHDRLRRKSEVDQLMILVEHAPTPFVLSLDAEWGTGKTTFVKMWRQVLANAGYRTIYFNAWETDFIAEPLVALVGEVASLLPRRTQAARTAQQKLKAATGLILKKATPVAARVLTAGLLDFKAEDLRGLSLSADDFEKAIGETAEKVVEAALDRYKRHRNEVEDFRSALRQAVKVAAAGKPLVFFVDELDRCRPTFAVELLERIKHLFEVPGVFFVLSVHREQLAHSLKAIYGRDFDAESYLGRFFDLSYRLPEPQSDDYAKYLAERVGYAGAQAVTQPLTFLMTQVSLTLRQQERCLTRAALVRRIIGRGNRNDDPTLYAALLVIREWNPGLYSQFRSGEKSVDDLIDALEAVAPDRWTSQEDTQDIEVALFVMEHDRREDMRRGRDERLSPWRSLRLDRYHQDTGEPDKPGTRPRPRLRASRILQSIERLQGDESRYLRRGQWRRTLAILELGGQFQVLDAQPP